MACRCRRRDVFLGLVVARPSTGLVAVCPVAQDALHATRRMASGDGVFDRESPRLPLPTGLPPPPPSDCPVSVAVDAGDVIGCAEECISSGLIRLLLTVRCMTEGVGETKTRSRSRYR